MPFVAFLAASEGGGFGCSCEPYAGEPHAELAGVTSGIRFILGARGFILRRTLRQICSCSRRVWRGFGQDPYPLRCARRGSSRLGALCFLQGLVYRDPSAGTIGDLASDSLDPVAFCCFGIGGTPFGTIRVFVVTLYWLLSGATATLVTCAILFISYWCFDVEPKLAPTGYHRRTQGYTSRVFDKAWYGVIPATNVFLSRDSFGVLSAPKIDEDGTQNEGGVCTSSQVSRSGPDQQQSGRGDAPLW